MHARFERGEHGRRYRILDRVVILLIGAGTMWDALARRIRDERLTNVRLVPYLPFARVPEIYGATQLSLVPLAAATGADAVPSKVFRIMACNGAVLAMTDAHSDLARIVTEAGCPGVRRRVVRSISKNMSP